MSRIYCEPDASDGIRTPRMTISDIKLHSSYCARTLSHETANSEHPCPLRINVNTQNTPEEKLQCNRCHGFGRVMSNCSYAPKCVGGGDIRPSKNGVTPAPEHKWCSCWCNQLQIIVVAASGKRQGGCCKASARKARKKLCLQVLASAKNRPRLAFSRIGKSVPMLNHLV
jgi:hypothetical protein